MGRHAKLSASGAHRWMKCPGSIQLYNRLVNEEVSTFPAAAMEGTKAHSLAEAILHYWWKNRKKDPNGLRLEDMWQPGIEFPWSYNGTEYVGVIEREMLDHVMVYVGAVIDMVNETVCRQLYLELKISLENTVRENMFGTADCVIDAVEHVIVIDFKYGFTPVYMRDQDGNINPQLMYYAAGALDYFKDSKSRVTLCIVQPRSMEVDSVQTIDISSKDVKHWAENTLWEAAHATDDVNAPLVPGDHCKFCAVLASCPAQEAELVKIAVSDFTEFTLPPVPVDLSRVLRMAPVIDAWLRACETEAQSRLERGEKVPGFKLVQKRTNRSWPDSSPEQVFKQLKKAGLPVKSVKDILSQPEVLSPAKIESAFGKKYAGAVNSVAVKPEGEYTMAAESDRREEVKPVMNDFEELM